MFGAFHDGGGKCIVAVVKRQRGEVLIHYYASDIGRYLRLIEQPKKKRQITYEDLANLDWAAYYFIATESVYFYPARQVCIKRKGIEDMSCSRTDTYEDLDGHFAPRPFAPKSEWISTTVTQ